MNIRLSTPIIFLIFILLIITCKKSGNDPNQNPDNADPIYLDPAFSVTERVDDLLARMTLEEKIGQMTQAERVALGSANDIKTHFLGSLLSGGGSAPTPNNASEWADMYDRFQTAALATRLAIPIIYGIDAVHGHNNVRGATIFPHNIGLGCTGNPTLVEQVARATAEEIAGTGIDWTFAPCIAVPRDERWGRTYEGFGETAQLAEQMGTAAVRGFQGSALDGPASVLACSKHFIGDGGTTNGTDQGETMMDEQTLRAIHLPGYIAAIQEGVGSIMVSYSSWNGQKMHGHRYLLTDVLKGELGFDGFLISDWAAIDQLPGDYSSDIEASINAGLDMIMVPDRFVEFISTLKNLVDQNRVPLTRIDDAVKRILRIKFQMGLFENPYTDRAYTGTVGSPQHREIARESVRQSLVLLQNDNNRLPLAKNLARIHVAGKNADDLGHQCGGWSISWQGGSGDITVGTTILEAIENTVSAGTQVSYSLDGSGAAGADVAVVVIGETPYTEGAGDRSDLSLSLEDLAAIDNVHSSGVPLVLLLVSGRPMIITPVLGLCDAVIAAWLPGTEGQGVADVLFGDYSPTGKLTHSWPADMSQIPINLGDAGYNPLFPYGYGLTY